MCCLISSYWSGYNSEAGQATINHLSFAPVVIVTGVSLVGLVVLTEFVTGTYTLFVLGSSSVYVLPKPNTTIEDVPSYLAVYLVFGLHGIFILFPFVAHAQFVLDDGKYP